jgi:hypothetical protein
MTEYKLKKCPECGQQLRFPEDIGGRAHLKKVGRYSHKITSLDKPHKLVYYNPGLE